jgi:hypothetical protein
MRSVPTDRRSAIATAVDTYNEVIYGCPTCKHPWTLPDTYPANAAFDTHVKKFIRMLNETNKLQANLGCAMRFEIAGESDKS